MLIGAGALLMQSENISSAIGSVTALVIAIAGIIAAVMEYFGRKKEGAQVKRFTSLWGQKTVENIPRMAKIYELMKKSGQLSPELAAQIEAEARKVDEAAKVGSEQLQIVEEALKPHEKADSLIIPRESTDTKPIPRDPAATPTIKVETKK